MMQAPHTGAINAHLHLGGPGDSTMLAYGENERLTVPFVRPEDVIPFISSNSASEFNVVVCA